jgi:hypothetical protein
MPDEKLRLNGPTQLLLAALALLPLWYSAGKKLSAGSNPERPSPYSMVCQKCGLEYFCGPDGIPGMKCLRCDEPKPTMVFHRDTGVSLWDAIVPIFLGGVSFLSVVVLIVGTNRPKKPVKKEETPQTAEAPAVPGQELKNWARELIEERRRRFE